VTHDMDMERSVGSPHAGTNKAAHQLPSAGPKPI
jgi:hypothetical protein